MFSLILTFGVMLAIIGIILSIHFKDFCFFFTGFFLAGFICTSLIITFHLPGFDNPATGWVGFVSFLAVPFCSAILEEKAKSEKLSANIV